MSRYVECPYCGELIEDKVGVMHKHSLTTGLVFCLRRLWDVGGHVDKVGELKLTYSQESNFQKNRYYGFVAKVDYNRKRGSGWLLTPNGALFLTGKYKVGKFAWSKDGYLIRREAPMVTIHDIERTEHLFVGYDEYCARMRPLGKTAQLDLFARRAAV